MRVLFVSASPIKKEISVGNTFLNLFSGMDDVEFASICTRTGAPDPLIKRCFCITEKMLIRNILRKGPAGAERKYTSAQSGSEAVPSESGMIRFVKKRRWNIFFLVQNLLWSVSRWKSAQLMEFIKDYDPDIIFAVFSDKIYLNRLIIHIKNITKKSLVVYAWDNNYSLKKISFSPFEWIGHFFNRHYMRCVAKEADKFYVISDLQKKDYEKAFNKECKVMTKAEDFSKALSVKETLSYPLKMVYTGNLYANRWRSLEKLVNVLERINGDSIKAQLYIYSATQLNEKMRKALERKDISYLMGCVSSGEVKKIQADADILVLAEPTDLKNRLVVRQSFSTKIVDYLKAARTIVSVGSKSIASNKHLIDYDCAIVADNEQELYEKLTLAFEDTQQLRKYAIKAYECGRSCHDKKQQKEILNKDLFQLIKR